MSNSVKHMMTYGNMSLEAAKTIVSYINENPNTLICFAAGDTPKLTYEILVQMQREKEVDLNSCFYIGLDEWVGLGIETKGTCIRFMSDTFYKPAGISEERMCVFEGKNDPKLECEKMESWLDEKGPIGLTVLGIGLNGHVGFNEPNADSSAITLIVELDDTTRTVGQKYFKTDVLIQKGVTMGLGALLKANEIILLASGEKKIDIVHQALDGEISMDIPASMLRNNNNLTVILGEGM